MLRIINANSLVFLRLRELSSRRSRFNPQLLAHCHIPFVETFVNFQKFAQFSGTVQPHPNPLLIKEREIVHNFHPSDQNRRRKIPFFRDNIETMIHSVDHIYIRATRLAVHHNRALSSTARSMGRQVVLARIRLRFRYPCAPYFSAIFPNKKTAQQILGNFESWTGIKFLRKYFHCPNPKSNFS